MTRRREIPRETKANQERASRPDASAWVSANAGSGKTHVLTQRVVRLLLDGVPASKILCLTFTKAAAANMSLRVFDTLARWTSLDDDMLAEAIAATGATLRPGHLKRARTLFSRTIESPGGLKIQTIHGFCESILHMFPFEANVPAGFLVVDDERKSELLERAKALAFRGASSNRAVDAALAHLSRFVSTSDFDALIKEAISRRGDILEMAQRCDDWPLGYRDEFAGAFGLTGSESADEISTRVVENGFAPETLRACADILDQGGTNDRKLAEAMRSAAAMPSTARRDAYFDLFLNPQGLPRGNDRTQMISKALQSKAPDMLPTLLREATRVAGLLRTLKSAEALERSHALMIAVDEVLRHYAELKRASALVDFDDLIERTRTLLSRSDAQWVLYKLDSGIDHILVDEAQDTSAAQWSIIEALTQEFTAGEGRAGVRRTFFAVGDEKQSIFSFQGADPRLFSSQRIAFGKRALDGHAPIPHIPLHYSFRSAPGILDAVDHVFESEANRRGLTSEGLKPTHSAWKGDLPGLVEIWPPIGAMEREAKPDWRLPLDAIDSGDPAAILAERISTLIESLIAPASPERVFDEASGAPRSIHGGDIMILMRRRGDIFNALINTLKRRGLPVAGADRLVLKDHIAVMDLIALGAVCLLPEDDLALASLLKSPLIDLDDDDLIELAPSRKGSLFDALADSGHARHRAALAKLSRWRSTSREMTPFQFYTGVVEADGGRADLVARIGLEASDAIDEFLRLALASERRESPSLARFLHRIETSDAEVRRDMEAAGRAIRVMTVHAAKGLESKIVLLPDTCQVPSDRFDPKLYVLKRPDGVSCVAWSPGKTQDCAAIADARQRAREDRMGEYRRLLYVAMTRAEERLYIMGHYRVRQPDADCWHQMISDALESRTIETPAPWGADESIRRLQQGDWAQMEASPVDTAPSAPEAAKLPAWLSNPARAFTKSRQVERPSVSVADQTARNATFDGGRAEALEIGRLTHLLLQRLPEIPEHRRSDAASALLTGRVAPDVADRLARQARAVLDMPALRPLFGAGSIAEARLAGSAENPDGAVIEIDGRVDRLAIVNDDIWFADFKTGRSTSSDNLPADYVRQMALYAAVLRASFPSRVIRAFLIWIEGPDVVELPQDRLSSSLADGRK